MPIKPFDLSGGGGLGYAVGHRNDSRNLPDGGGKMEVLVEVVMVVVEVEVLMMEVVVEMVEVKGIVFIFCFWSIFWFI